MRALMPREHGLLAWVGLPMAAALAQRPTLPAALAVGAVLAGFGAFNALRRAEAGLALTAGLLAGALGLAAARGANVGLALGAAAGGALLAARLLPAHLPRAPILEGGAILACNALGAAIALGCGARPERAGVLALMLVAWQVTGLWWVRRSLAGVLPRRAPWRAGAGVALGLAGAAVAAGCWYGLLAIPAALLLYPLRMAAHPPPTSPRQAAAVGLTELGWSVLALALALLGTG